MLASYTDDLEALRRQLAVFRDLLDEGRELRERQDLLPFFARHRHIAASLGYANNQLALPDLLGIECEVFDFRCDVLVGDSRTGQFTLVELEDATRGSIFRTGSGRRAYPRWSPRYETGFSQLVDWAWRIDQERPPSVTLEPVFGTKLPKIHYLLLIGRDRWLNGAAGARLDWRRRHNGIHGQLTSVWTYDFFLDFVRLRVTGADRIALPGGLGATARP